MADTEYAEVIKKLATILGMKALASLSGRLDPEQLIGEAETSLNTNLKETFKEILGDVDSDVTQDLIDKIYNDLDIDQVIDTIKDPLVMAIVGWIKVDSRAMDSIVSAIVEGMDDTDEFRDLLAKRVSSRIQLSQQD